MKMTNQELNDEILKRDYSEDELPKEFAKYVEQLIIGDFTLSYSSIKAFSESPLSFLRYKTKDKKRTPSMEFGSLLHTLVLEPTKFESEYIILDKLVKESTWAKKENKIHKSEIELKALEEKKQVVTMENLTKALDLKKAILKNSYAGYLINGCIEYEKPIKFDWYNFTWTGYIDGLGQNYIIDLKKVTDARPHKIKWRAIDAKWNWQAFLYLQGTEKNHGDHNHFYNICYDDNGNVSVIRQTWMDVNIALASLVKICDKFNDCIIQNTWDYSYEFWTENGYYKSDQL